MLESDTDQFEPAHLPTIWQIHTRTPTVCVNDVNDGGGFALVMEIPSTQVTNRLKVDPHTAKLFMTKSAART